MTGYESKKAAAIAKTIDEVNWADHEPNGLAQPAQEPVAWLCKADKNGMFGLPTADKACKDCFPVYAAPPRPAHEPVANDRALQLVTYQMNHWRAYALELQERLVKYEGGAPMLLNKEKNNGRPWVGLEGEEIRYLWERATKPNSRRSTMTMVTSFAKDIETKLNEKNS